MTPATHADLHKPKNQSVDATASTTASKKSVFFLIKSEHGDSSWRSGCRICMYDRAEIDMPQWMEWK